MNDDYIKEQKYKQMRQKMMDQKENLKNTLAEEFGVVGNKKLDTLFDLSWEYGHSYGNNEVRSYFMDLVVLIE